MPQLGQIDDNGITDRVSARRDMSHGGDQTDQTATDESCGGGREKINRPD